MAKIITEKLVTIYNDDCFSVMKEMPDNSVDLIVTSPPYCIGKPYDDYNTSEDFLKEQKRLFPELYRILKPKGSMCIQVGYHVSRGRVVPLDYLVMQAVDKNYDLILRNRIIWHFGHGLHAKKRFSGRHETILWFTKGSDYHFNLDAVRVPQKYPGKTAYKGKQKGQLSGNPLGKNPSDVWEMPNVNANHIEKTEHPCQYPVGLVQKLIRGLCPEEGVVFDPFMGAGTTAVAALLEQRFVIGAEIERSYFEIIKIRIQKTLEGTIKVRNLGLPVFTPNPNSKVAKKPAHFKGNIDDVPKDNN